MYVAANTLSQLKEQIALKKLSEPGGLQDALKDLTTADDDVPESEVRISGLVDTTGFVDMSDVDTDMFSFERHERAKMMEMVQDGEEDDVFLEAASSQVLEDVGAGRRGVGGGDDEDEDEDEDEEIFVEAKDSRDDQLSATELRRRHNIHNQEHEESTDMDYLNTILGIAVQQNYYTLETKNRDDADGRHPLKEGGEEEVR